MIHGVAGSGKTMILGFRCLQMAQVTAKPILVLCFNIALAARLQWTMERQGVADKVVVCHFHDWCKRMVKAFNVSEPPWVYNDFEGSSDRRVQALIQAVNSGQVPRAQYGAIMIDEGHDFEPEWLRLVVQMLDPDNDSLLVLYDDAQNINHSKSRKSFTFKSVGVQAVGRTTILKLNYRNTLEVLSVAQAFAKELLSESGGSEDDMPIIAPESVGRRGDLPELMKLASLDAECAHIADRITDEVDNGRSPSDIAILCRHQQQMATMES
ncbi:MAG: DEAD/DEAH box helicase, partial [Gammaproteobacteria bacterium]